MARLLLMVCALLSIALSPPVEKASVLTLPVDRAGVARTMQFPSAGHSAAPSMLQPAEACCLPDGTCLDMPHNNCALLGGDPQGGGTLCNMGIMCSPIKWSQPPLYFDGSPHPECFWGWDEYSVFGSPQWIVADDWLCDSALPVTNIHWWGSYIGSDQIPPPASAPHAYHIGIWTDVPAGMGTPFSHPGIMRREWIVSRTDLNERPVACDFHPEHMSAPDGCYKYDFVIPAGDWFIQEPACNIYWVSIAAMYPACACNADVNGDGQVNLMDQTLLLNCIGQPPAGQCAGADVNCDGVIDNDDNQAWTCLFQGLPPQQCCAPTHPWGWKSREHFFQDDAVRILAPTAPVIGMPFEFGEPIEDMLGASWDMSFVLTTEGQPEACCLPDGSCLMALSATCQAMGGITQDPGTMCTQPEACCLPDGSCAMADPLCCDELGGTPMGPGMACGGHLDACCLQDGTCVMADPTCCPLLGGIAQGPGTVCTAPQACCLPDDTCANLDPLCCVEVGGLPQGAGTACAAAPQACCLPDGSCRMVDPLCCDDIGGTAPPTGAQVCLGDANQNQIDDACEVPGQACCLPDGSCIVTDHTDCVNRGGDPQGPGTTCPGRICSPIKWAQPPVFDMTSPVPDCFYGWDEHSHFDCPGCPIMADDWPCDDGRPVTDIHWWGSYVGWMEPVPPEPGMGPEAFHIGVWTDVPAGVDQPFSHPGVMVWDWMVPRMALNERMVGCDFHPVYPGPDSCFRYDFVIPEPEWFIQEPACNIYWVSIAAWYPMQPPPFVWGWKTRPHFFQDDAVRILAPNPPVRFMPYMSGEPLLDPFGVSWDMAFVVTTGGGPNQPADPPHPHNRQKNRYVSFAPNNGSNVVAFRIDKVAAPGAGHWVGAPDANGMSQVVGAPVFRAWPEAVVHVGDCEIVPVATYHLMATADGVSFSPPLALSTIAQPAPKFWGDTVGVYDGVEWTPPQGVVNTNDFIAAMQKFQGLPSSPHLCCVDVQSVSAIDPCLNKLCNMADVFIIIKAFQGDPYPFTTDPTTCPPCP